MDINARNLCRHVTAGSTVEITGAYHSTLAAVVRSGWGKLVARPERPVAEDGRVLIRVPLVGALLQASARLSPGVEGGEPCVFLDTFANVQCQDRRGSARLYEPLAVRISSDAGLGDRVLTAVNVGPRGILIAWPGQPEVALGERLALRFSMDGREIPTEGEVIRVDHLRSAVRFLEIAAEDQMYITGCIFRREYLHGSGDKR